MRLATPALLVSMLLPSFAVAAEPTYPRVVRRDGQVCVQNLDASGAVVESCRNEGDSWTGREKAKPQALPAAGEAQPIPASPAVEEPVYSERGGGNPVRVGRLHGEAHAEGGRYFAGSFVSSALAGPGLWLSWAMLAGASDPTPPGNASWENPVNEAAYRQAFKEEARDRRFWNAMGGGAIGTAVFIGLVLLVAN